MLINTLTKMGTSGDRNEYTGIARPTLLSHMELEALYISSWLCRRVIHLPAGEATRVGWDLGLGSDEKKSARKNSDKLVAYSERLNFRRYVREALRKARLYGGAVLIVLVDDGTAKIEGMAEEVRYKTLRTIKGFHVLDCTRIWPAPGWGGVGEPEAYQFNTEADPALVKAGLSEHATITVHASRVLRFEGEPAPTYLQASLNWWGLSVLQPIWDVFKRYESGQQSSSQILHDFDLFVHKIPDLRRMLAAGREDDVARRFEVQALVRSTYGALLLGDEEEASFITRSAGGIADVLTQLKAEVTGASGIPHTKLWGESPSGLGATGRSEDQAFSADVADLQDHYLRTPIRKFYELAMKAQDAPFRDPPDDWTVKFRPTHVRTEEETAELYTKVASADSQWINAGVLQAHEAAVARFGRPEFSLDTTLIDRESDGSVKQEEFDPASVSFGGGMAPPVLGADGQPVKNPPAQPYPGPAGAAPKPPGRTDAADGEACCESCAAGKECEEDCDGESCDAEEDDKADDDDRPSVGETMHRWKHGTLHSGTGKKGEHRNELRHGPDTFKQAVAIALSIAGKDEAPSRRGRRRKRNDSLALPGRHMVVGCVVDARQDGTATLVGPYGQLTPYQAVIGRETRGAFEVMAPSGEYFLVLGHDDADSLQAAAGPDARIRRIDSIDLVAMGIRCDAYAEG